MSDYDGRTDAGTFYVRIASMQLWPDVVDVSPMWDRGGPVEHRRYVPERTCHAEEVPMGIHDDLTATVCSACHVAVDDLEDCYYCPWCGAKVVSG